MEPEKTVSADTGEVEIDEEKEQLISSFDEIVAARKDVMECEKEEARTKKLHASAKAALDKAWLKLGEVIDEQQKAFEPNLFNQPKPDDEAWRTVFVGDLGLGDTITEKLIQADINELGKLADWSNSGKQLTDLPGIGAQSAEKIQDALTAFWKKRSDAEAAKKAAAEATAATAAEQKARRAQPPAATAEDKAKAKQEKIIAEGLAAMGISPEAPFQQPPPPLPVDTTEMTKGW